MRKKRACRCGGALFRCVPAIQIVKKNRHRAGFPDSMPAEKSCKKRKPEI